VDLPDLDAASEDERGTAVRLRLATPADADVIWEWMQDQRVHRWWGGTPPTRAEVASKYTGARSPAVLVHLIEADGRAVGLIQAWQRPHARGLDMFLAADDQGRGIGPVAARALAGALTRHGWRDLSADPAVDDSRAIRAWSTAGFVPTGCYGSDEGRPTLIMVFQP
jgi:aminoglycoside 6'-N-acetyltransferase